MVREDGLRRRRRRRRRSVGVWPNVRAVLLGCVLVVVVVAAALEWESAHVNCGRDVGFPRAGVSRPNAPARFLALRVSDDRIVVVWWCECLKGERMEDVGSVEVELGF
jgi:hypothetical protein